MLGASWVPLRPLRPVLRRRRAAARLLRCAPWNCRGQLRPGPVSAQASAAPHPSAAGGVAG